MYSCVLSVIHLTCSCNPEYDICIEGTFIFLQSSSLNNLRLHLSKGKVGNWSPNNFIWVICCWSCYRINALKLTANLAVLTCTNVCFFAWWQYLLMRLNGTLDIVMVVFQAIIIIQSCHDHTHVVCDHVCFVHDDISRKKVVKCRL